MPVILGNKDSVSAWLNDASVKLEEITTPYEGDDLVWYPVTSAMGKTSFDGPECIKEVPLGPSEKPISKFFTKKSTVHDQPAKPEKTFQELTETNAPIAAKVECDESVEYQSGQIKQQQLGDKHTTWNAVKDEPVTLQPQVLEKPQRVKHDDVILADADVMSAKRKIENTEVNLDTKMENRGRSPLLPMKKGKGSKAASDGQASLFSYFAKK
ncbi:hypothetical protein PR202_gb12907 [Eleusine coracana subsp. coracana]|uniref:DNA polymerase delta subunit 3 n=1 Tax=Eleusine coracana subsp. coracana TaxID=191504 RepID=A0AAV5EP45_ELECO|nr:hypothetical protein PR202_gb12907 [Eleusine coracana subsp. coracana]